MFMTRLLSAGAVTVLAVGQAAAEILYAGVNSAGGEFAQQNLPGTFGIDYQFINETAIDFFLKAGVNTIRLPFLLVRPQQLHPESRSADHITAKGGYVILDAHNYMRYNDPSMQPFSGSIIG
ncbi:hypothetical protein GQ44DRAFT_563260, partial [Phaeosphaeriaceae sp. PMI808]